MENTAPKVAAVPIAKHVITYLGDASVRKDMPVTHAPNFAQTEPSEKIAQTNVIVAPIRFAMQFLESASASLDIVDQSVKVAVFKAVSGPIAMSFVLVKTEEYVTPHQALVFVRPDTSERNVKFPAHLTAMDQRESSETLQIIGCSFQVRENL